jgi:hypothetical protein
MDTDRTDQKRDRETGHWVSDLKPGATTEAKVDKSVEDTFPASDPVHKAGETGFIAAEGVDTAQRQPAASGRSGAAAGQLLATPASAMATAGRHPLAVLLVAGAMAGDRA